MVRHQVDAFIEAQGRWAGPLGDRVQPILARLLNENREVKDFLNGTWLGHPVHPAITDVPVGAMTVAALFDLAGADGPADAALLTGLAGMAAAVPGGAADAVDTFEKPRVMATLHAVLMTASFGTYLASFMLRIAGRRPGGRRGFARLLGFAGYGILTAGAYVGGDLAYRLGNQVDRHAWRRIKRGWQPLELPANIGTSNGAGTSAGTSSSEGSNAGAGEIPENTPLRAMLGKEPVLVVRRGQTIHAMHAICAHQGGPLDKGTLVDGCIECPWHQSQFRLADGVVVQGPAVYDQPSFDVRRTAEGRYEACLRESVLATG